MMAPISLIPATEAHVLSLAQRLRASDLAELAAEGHEAVAGIEIARRRSAAPMVAVLNGQVEAMFGVMPAGDGIGAPWMVGSDQMRRHPQTLMRLARTALIEMAGAFWLLRNQVDARNEQAIRWLTRLGFTMEPAAPHGPAGHPFVVYHMQVQP